MNEEQIKGNWNQFKGLVKEKWGMLTDDEVQEAEGRADYLGGKIQEYYGISKEKAEKEVDEFFKGLRD